MWRLLEGVSDDYVAQNTVGDTLRRALLHFVQQKALGALAVV